ncbi:hypothetical protein ACHQM5_018091 [Ranunculus cassubicifolius]
MHTIKEKLSNMSSSTKQHVKSSNANIEEKAGMVIPKSKDEKELVHERRKAKDAKADHKADKLNARHARVVHGHTPETKTTTLEKIDPS